MAIFVQFFVYREKDEDDETESAVETPTLRERGGSQRPLLERDDSGI
jgi:hypothetical protein